MNRYRGWQSTKLHLSLITMGLVVFGFGMAGFGSDLYGEFCMALIGAAGVYSGSAAAEKFAGPKADPGV